MEKIDLKKTLKHLYCPSPKEVSVVDVPKMKFLMIDGAGDPNTSEAYQASIEALYSVSYTLKFMLKKSSEAIDYSVMPLEGFWWADDCKAFSSGNKDEWKWTSAIMQPEYVTPALYEEARQQVVEKKKIAAASQMRMVEFQEGLSAQILYIGPYSEESPTIQRLHSFIAEQSGTLTGKHHEIYLGDPRRTAPEKLKTVLRQPFLRKSE
jgi:hypothetical protein